MDSVRLDPCVNGVHSRIYDFAERVPHMHKVLFSICGGILELLKQGLGAAADSIKVI